MIHPENIPSHSPSVVTRKTGNEYVLVPVTNNIADMNSVFTLNETAAFIWDLIDGKRNVEDIIGLLIEEYDTDRLTATTDVNDFIENIMEFLIII